MSSWFYFRSQRPQKDNRTRRNRVRNRNAGFQEQLPLMANAFMTWQMDHEQQGLDSAGPPVSAEGEDTGIKVTVVDVFREFY